MGRPIDRRAVDLQVVEHLPAALRFARRLVRDDAHAEDLVQEALCRVLARWRTYRGESSFRTWLLQIVLNVHRDRTRRPHPEPIHDNELPAAGAEPHELAAAAELDQEIQRAIDNLPDRQREVALLAWGERLTTSEVATILGITEQSVYTNLHLARKRIAAAIGVDSNSK